LSRYSQYKFLRKSQDWIQQRRLILIGFRSTCGISYRRVVRPASIGQVRVLEQRTAELKHKQAQIAVLESKIEDLKAKHAYFETVAARLDALELRNNHSIQITAEKSLRDNLWQQ
jgi:hypothetical protein